MFKAPSFDPSLLRREPAAILSAVVGFGLEGYSQQVSRSLSLALSQNEVPLQVIPAYEALSRINRAGLAKEYTDMVAAYVQSGILDHAYLQRVGQAVGASYAFQPSMASFDQSMAGRFSFFGLRVFQTRISMLRLSLQLWDTRTGSIVWEASGEATLANEDVREFRIPFEDIARRLWDRILRDLRSLVKESPQAS